MLILALPFGPPVHGMSVIADALFNKLEERGVKYIKIPSQPWFAHRLYGTALWTIIKVAYSALFCLALIVNCVHKRPTGIYLFLQGGVGQVLDLPIYLIARIFGLPIFIHHHSFSYIVSESFVMRLSNIFMGKLATHIFLCKCMYEEFTKIYSPSYLKYCIVSNVVFLEEKSIREENAGNPFTLGYLSNITSDKGIRKFIECFDNVSQSVIVNALVAGRCDDLEIKKMLLTKSGCNDSFNYIGPAYDEAKDDFFDSIDVLIFPTEYKTEADPVVILEALQRGIPVVSYSRGCIEQTLNLIGGLAIDQDADFVKLASEEIIAWISSPLRYRAEVTLIENKFKAFRNQHSGSLNDLVDTICGH